MTPSQATIVLLVIMAPLLVHSMEIKVFDNVAVLRNGEVSKFRHNNHSKDSSARRHARWTFQNLQEDNPVNGTEALHYEPIVGDGTEWAMNSTTNMEEKSPRINNSNGENRPDKILKSNKDAMIIMSELSSLKSDFCRTDTIVQRVKVEGCIGRNVVNKYCYGQCNSFYIPEGPKKRRGGGGGGRGNKRNLNRPTPFPDYLEDEDLTVPVFKSCPFCRPTKVVWVTITLKCPSLTPPYRKKRVQKIRQCKCMDDSAAGY